MSPGATIQNSMQKACRFVLTVLMLSPRVFGQDGAPTIKSQVSSAFIWGEDSPSGAVSSTVRDPLTGNNIRKLSYAGIEVSSRIGFERAGANEPGTLLNYSTTIINSTDATLSVRYGGISVDGHAVPPLSVVPAGRKLSKKERTAGPDALGIGEIRCLKSGFVSADHLFSANASSQVLAVAPRSALTVSSVIRDPRTYHSVVCSVDGCLPTGTIRYYLRVDDNDYVFVWPGRSAVYCGN